MSTLEERVAHIEKFLSHATKGSYPGDDLMFVPIPDPRYVRVILDESVARENRYLKPYTYEDKTMPGLKVGDRVVVPIGARGTKAATVIATSVKPDGPYVVKTVAGVL
jgi:hypothetical protein